MFYSILNQYVFFFLNYNYPISNQYVLFFFLIIVIPNISTTSINTTRSTTTTVTCEPDSNGIRVYERTSPRVVGPRTVFSDRRVDKKVSKTYPSGPPRDVHDVYSLAVFARRRPLVFRSIRRRDSVPRESQRAFRTGHLPACRRGRARTSGRPSRRDVWRQAFCGFF